MPKRTTNFRSDLLGDLKNPREALQYLNATLSPLNCPLDNDMFLTALRDIIEANMDGILTAAQEDGKDLDWYENQLRIDPDDKFVWNQGEQRIKAVVARSGLRSYSTLREAIRAERVK